MSVRTAFFALGGALILLPGLLLSPPAAAQQSPLDAPTISAFLAACKINQSSCSSAVGAAALTGAMNGSLCLTNSTNDYTLPVIAWLGAHGETAAMKTHDGLMLALKTVYPC